MIKIRKMISRPTNYSQYRNEILLIEDNWDDYSYRTTFYLQYVGQDGKCNINRCVQIYCEDMEKAIEAQEFPVWSKKYVPEVIERLDERFCSLGQDLRYYEELKQFIPNEYTSVLERLNDIAYDNFLWEKFKEKKGVQLSLLRSSSAQKARREAYTIFNDDCNTSKNVSFSYVAKVPYTYKEIPIKFSFTKREDIPYRINALVGKNGTGKTSILKDLAMDLSGFVDNDIVTKYESFAEYMKYRFENDERPVFDKIISISYSVFDPFDKRIGRQSLGSYVYCGIQTTEGVMQVEQIRSKFVKALTIVREKDRESIWKKVIQELFQNEENAILDKIICEKYDDIHWSSGQNILLLSVTETVAYIEKESIILLDEPELHLHPNAIANFMRMLSEVLEYFDSYAIISTHSPIILQEIMSSNVNIIYKIDGMPCIRRPSVECFGENITRIIQDVFPISNSESGYQSVFSKLKDKGLTKQQIIDSFTEYELGMNALIYLEQIYRNESNQNA